MGLFRSDCREAAVFSRLTTGGSRSYAEGGECGGGKTPPKVSRRKDQAGRLGTQEKPLPQDIQTAILYTAE